MPIIVTIMIIRSPQNTISNKLGPYRILFNVRNNGINVDLPEDHNRDLIKGLHSLEDFSVAGAARTWAEGVGVGRVRRTGLRV